MGKGGGNDIPPESNSSREGNRSAILSKEDKGCERCEVEVIATWMFAMLLKVLAVDTWDRNGICRMIPARTL